jgi:hypothetical protein
MAPPRNEHFCTEPPELLCHRNIVRFGRTAELNRGYRLSPARCPDSQRARFHRGFAAEDAWNGSTRRRFCVSAGVPVLWTHHAALRNMLLGVWQGT